jgi:hypothetical protein
VWGGWHDAGDWDREDWHPTVSNELLLTYELAPHKFRDGELNIPESGNGIPDIVDEARWVSIFTSASSAPTAAYRSAFFRTAFPEAEKPQSPIR